MALINGKHVEISSDMTLLQYIKQHNFSLTSIAVEYNGEILPRAQYGKTVLHADDVIEIVNFVGGG